MSNTPTRFPDGLFAPSPQRASARKVLAAQARIESLLFLRHGEQQLLSLVIPLVMLIGFSLLPGLLGDRHVNNIYPMTLAIALMGAGFTGQAIAVAFDRRYGALKRIGASGVPTWALIGGKVCAVAVVVVVQILILTVAAILLGWAPHFGGVPAALLVVVVGVAAFTSFGLLLGGTLSSELVLALANTAWFILLGAAVFASLAGGMSDSVRNALMVIPSVALTEGIGDALNQGRLNLGSVLILAVWTAGGIMSTLKCFRFTMDND